MQYFDISRKIHEGMAVYPNNPLVELAGVIEAGEGKSALSRLTLGTHTGTHIDAPSHIKRGARGTSVYPLDQLCGLAEVVDMRGVKEVISAADLPVTTQERVLFLTRNSEGTVDVFDESFVALDESAAKELVRRGVRGVGIDALSIKKKGVSDATHEILLEAGVYILEGLWLYNVMPGKYELLCLPLALDANGAPARAVLRRE